jgi:hypothetical protein
MPKTIPATLKSLLDEPIIQAVQDRTQDVEPLARTMLDHWSLDLYTRRPGPALNSRGEFVGTDLDLATFMSALAQRGAVIVIPHYETMRAATKREGERRVGDHRIGKIMSLYANKEAFSFGVRVDDQSVITQDALTGNEETGAPRNFTLIDVTGKWHDGWSRIEFSATAKENDFLRDKRLWTGSQVIFKYFVHPNRWQSFYGNPYFQTKALVARLTEEAAHLSQQIKKLQDAGVKYPDTSDGSPKEWAKSEKVGTDRPVAVDAFQAEVDLPQPNGEFRNLRSTETELVAAMDKRKRIVYGLTPQLTFAVRAVELAFFQFGFQDPQRANEKMPGWIEAEWERDFVPKGRRTPFNRLVLFQRSVGEFGVALRYRCYKKTERIAD